MKLYPFALILGGVLFGGGLLNARMQKAFVMFLTGSAMLGFCFRADFD